MKLKVAIIAVFVFISAGCAELMNVMQTVSPVPLTEADVISGLKEALITGARNSAGKLGAENGYFGDAAVKILLPDDAKIIVDNITKLPGGQNLLMMPY